MLLGICDENWIVFVESFFRYRPTCVPLFAVGVEIVFDASCLCDFNDLGNLALLAVHVGLSDLLGHLSVPYENEAPRSDTKYIKNKGLHCNPFVYLFELFLAIILNPSPKFIPNQRPGEANNPGL